MHILKYGSTFVYINKYSPMQIYVKMKQLPIAVNKLQEINAGLPHGALKRVALKTRKSSNYISYVLSGQYFNAEVVEALIEEYNKEKEKVASLNAKIDSALQS